MAEYDLTSKIGSYLDRHLVLPMLEFLSEKKVYDESDMLRAKIQLLGKTNMVDYAIDIYKQLHQSDEEYEGPDEMVERRKEVVYELQEWETKIDPILTILGEPEVAEQMKEEQNVFDYLTTEHDFNESMKAIVYDVAKFKYECGNYSDAADHLYFYTLLSPPQEAMMAAMWGKLSCSILMQDWDVALEDLGRLRRDIDETTNISHLMRLQQRTWLMHWSLFIFFHHPKGLDEIITLFLYQQDYLNAIQTSCPHLLRYLTAAVITNKRRQSLLKDLVRVIRQQSFSYKDPITEFVERLYINFDFDEAQQKLSECERLLDYDFFLISCKEEFIESARLCVFETFCRIHHCISISMLATKLNMSSDNAEKWIVNLIRNAKLDAKIDAKEGHVIMMSQPTSIYQRVIDKTKSLAFQSQFLAQNIDKRLSQKIGMSAPQQQRWMPADI